MQKITPFLWFSDNAEQAVRFYTSIFQRSKILGMTHYSDAGPGPKGGVMTVRFRLAGQEFVALNGGPVFKFTPAVSFVVNCRDQREIDYFWRRLSAGGKIVECGWLQDKFGLSWQIVPDALGDLLGSGDAEKSERVMKAIFRMKKIELSELQAAFAGVPRTGRRAPRRSGLRRKRS